MRWTPSASLFGLAGILLVAWLGLLGILAFWTRPREPVPGPPTMDLPPEPPAVANFLVHGWRITNEAIPATLLDLAARRHLDIERAAPGKSIIRLRPARSDPVPPFERRVLDHLRKLALRGVVPAEAMATGPQDQSARWWKGFRNEVVTDSRERGLSRDRWSGGHRAILSIAALAPSVATAAAVASIAVRNGDDWREPVGAGFLLWVGLVLLVALFRDQRDTPAGLRAAGRWLGVQAYLRENQALQDLPPAAVVIWERYLAYAAAMGLARAAVRGLPLGAESDTEAWSSYGGRWRLVRIGYGARLRPGWGRTPLHALAAGLGWLAAGLGMAFLLWPVLVRTWRWELIEGLGAPFSVFLAALLLVTLLMTVVGPMLAILRGWFLLAWGLLDLNDQRSVDGKVLRIRSHDDATSFVAIDDGRSDRVRAWRVPKTMASRLSQGEHVRVLVRPRLGKVVSMTPVPEAVTSNS